jgi:hypothetical protein
MDPVKILNSAFHADEPDEVLVLVLISESLVVCFM